VERAAAPGDERVGVYLAEHVINGHYQAGFAAAENLEELRAIEARARGRVWLVTTLERILQAQHPDLHEHIQRFYTRDALLPATLGDGQMRIYVRDLSAQEPRR
jgi:hypothetical protein